MSNTSRIARIATAAGLLLALALLAACAAPAGSKTSDDGGSASSAPSTPPTMKLTVPTADATVPAGTVKVEVETTGLEFVMASTTNVAGEGHVHFTLDDRPFVMSVEPRFELEDVEPGVHTLEAELVQNDTQPFDPPVREEISFIAE